jgi:hypothetical protein
MLFQHPLKKERGWEALEAEKRRRSSQLAARRGLAFERSWHLQGSRNQSENLVYVHSRDPDGNTTLYQPLGRQYLRLLLLEDRRFVLMLTGPTQQRAEGIPKYTPRTLAIRKELQRSLDVDAIGTWWFRNRLYQRFRAGSSLSSALVFS